MGFFFADDAVLLQPRRQQAKPKKTEVVMSGERGCDACSLQETWNRIASPQMPISGAVDGDILILGEGPGEEEDIKNEAFVGKSGQMLRRHLPHRMLDRIALSNAVRCRPPGNRTPTGHEMYCCSVHLENDVAAGNYKAILGLGGAAMLRYFNEASITQMVGVRFAVEIGDKQLWYYPTFHPSFLLHNGGDKAREYPVFAASLKRFFSRVDKWTLPQIEKPRASDVITVYDEQAAYDLYHRLKKPFGIDLETSRLKPYHPNAQMLTAAFSDGELTFAFPIEHAEYTTEWGLALLLEAAADHQWIAHNASFELVWLLWYANKLGLGRWRPHTFDDSMAYGRLYHNRNMLLDLGTMSRIILGTNVKKLTQVNAANIAGYTLAEILPYNGLDAWASTRIVSKLKGKVIAAEYERIINSITSTTYMELLGLQVDRQASLALKQQWGGIAERKRSEAKEIYEVRQFIRERGQEFNIGNPDHVGIALVDYGREKLPKNKKSYSTDEELLRPIAEQGHPLAQCVLAYREAVKHDSTYIDPVLQVSNTNVDGLLHPSYTTMHVATFRTSSNEPNIQNWPKRRHREFRRQVVAPQGHVIAAFDMGQIQGRLYGMASRDPVLCQSFIDKEDIHSHWLGKLIELYPEYFDRLRVKLNIADADEALLRKRGRDQIKTDIVFASLFGTTAQNCAERTGIPFAVVNEVLDMFWTRFYIARRWLNARRAEYRDTGGVRTLTGQLRFGTMMGNEPVITPIQNGEAILVLEAQNELCEMALAADDMYLMPRINIHDDISFVLPDQEDRLETYIDTISKVMTRIRYKWQIVPLTVEVGLGYNWADLTPVTTFEGPYVR